MSKTLKFITMLLVATALVFASAAFGQEPAPPAAPSTSQSATKDGDKKQVKEAKKAPRVKKRLNRAGCFIRAPWVCRQNGKSIVSPKKMGWHLNKKVFGKKHWKALNFLWGGESGWRPFEDGLWRKKPRMNTQGSGACGIPQAKPCNKIPNPLSIRSQIMWGLRYIKKRYGNPTAALAFWLRQNPHWY